MTISPPRSPLLVHRFLISIKQACDLRIETTGPLCSLIMDVVTSNDTIQTKRAPFGGKAYIHSLPHHGCTTMQTKLGEMGEALGKNVMDYAVFT